MGLADYYYYKIVVTHQAEKNLMYDRTTVQGATFNLRGQLYRGHTKGTALYSIVQWSVHWASSRATRVLVLAGAWCCALETCGKKNLMI